MVPTVNTSHMEYQVRSYKFADQRMNVLSASHHNHDQCMQLTSALGHGHEV